MELVLIESFSAQISADVSSVQQNNTFNQIKTRFRANAHTLMPSSPAELNTTEVSKKHNDLTNPRPAHISLRNTQKKKEIKSHTKMKHI